MLPRTQHLLHNAIANWQDWHSGSEEISGAPKLIRRLTGGLTNESFLVGNQHFQAVVRVNGHNSLSLGIDRQREKILLEALSSLSCIPTLYYSDSNTLVTEYVDGRHPLRQDFADGMIQNQFRNALAAIQEIEVGQLETRCYVDYIRLYSDQLSNFIDLSIIEAAAQEIDNADWTPVIAHHDLISENIILNPSGVSFLDWEYSHLGHPLIDYLALFGAEACARKTDKKLLNALITLKFGIVKLWHAVQDTPIKT
ncbi:MAG: phosphotransferase [Porticoccaceae bacterium]|nr:phosphotransferase [Porticoccaceae bacterium]MDG1474152.1 phosphotransferase [Porticoccaceae bacterium]